MGELDLHMSVDFEVYVRSTMLTGQTLWYDCLCNGFSFKQAALQMVLAIVMKPALQLQMSIHHQSTQATFKDLLTAPFRRTFWRSHRGKHQIFKSTLENSLPSQLSILPSSSSSILPICPCSEASDRLSDIAFSVPPQLSLPHSSSLV
jgi:hypothetical protein